MGRFQALGYDDDARSFLKFIDSFSAIRWAGFDLRDVPTNSGGTGAKNQPRELGVRGSDRRIDQTLGIEEGDLWLKRRSEFVHDRHSALGRPGRRQEQTCAERENGLQGRDWIFRLVGQPALAIC